MPNGPPNPWSESNSPSLRQNQGGSGRALRILGDDVPPQLAEAARLRLENPEARMSELASKADPPITKDAYAGRIWRLLQRAEERARSQDVSEPAAVSDNAAVR
ncbi:sporulation transcription regulator whiA [Mycobacteroides abscessus subsp. abscessus]|nr:sporulation transcription regulator whiA [Mycobacteroides abscessus subsp. abscessus]